MLLATCESASGIDPGVEDKADACEAGGRGIKKYIYILDGNQITSPFLIYNTMIITSITSTYKIPEDPDGAAMATLP